MTSSTMIERESHADRLRSELKLIHQKSFVQTCMERFKLDNQVLRKSELPHERGKKQINEKGDTLDGQRKRTFQTMVGSLIFLATKTYFDIASIISRFMSNPSQEHMDAVIKT
jgi:hypothetical protein